MPKFIHNMGRLRISNGPFLKIKDLDIFDTEEEIEEFCIISTTTSNSIDEDVILNTNFYGYTQDNKYFSLY